MYELLDNSSQIIECNYHVGVVLFRSRCIGDLDWRHVVVWGNEHDPAVLIYWYNRYYAGATLEFRPLP